MAAMICSRDSAAFLQLLIALQVVCNATAMKAEGGEESVIMPTLSDVLRGSPRDARRSEHSGLSWTEYFRLEFQLLNKPIFVSMI